MYLVERRVRSDNACTLGGVGQGPESNEPVCASSEYNGTGPHNASVHCSDAVMLGRLGTLNTEERDMLTRNSMEHLNMEVKN